MACPLCSTRKAKRACPAVGRDICPVCCGTKRQIEIACPPECPYLNASRAHPPAVVQRRQERDMRYLLPRISDLSETQYRLFLFLQAVMLRHVKSAMPAPRDTDVADAAATIAATIETAGKGIIYEHRAPGLPAQRLVSEVSAALNELVSKAGSDAARLERDAAVALRHLERVAREAQRDIADETDPQSSWISLATRIAGGAAAATGQAPAAPDEGPRIVMP